MIDFDALSALTPEQRLARYQELRLLLAPLEAEKDALNALVKADLQSGATVETPDVRAVLKVSHSTTYPIEAFIAHFGPEQALSVATIDTKKVQAQIKKRDLSAAEVQEIAVVTPRSTALVIEPVRAA